MRREESPGNLTREGETCGLVAGDSPLRDGSDQGTGGTCVRIRQALIFRLPWFWCSCLVGRNEKVITAGAKRFRCAKVLFRSPCRCALWFT